MKIQISEQHFNDPKIKEYAVKKVGKLAKFHPKIDKVNIHLIAEKAHRNEKHDFVCEIEVVVPGHIFEIKDNQRSMDKAIDEATDRMRQILVKHKEKHITKKHKSAIVRKLIERFS